MGDSKSIYSPVRKMVTKLWILFKRGGWAPFAVLLFHQFVGRMPGWRAHTDWLLHFLGGLSVAYFLYHAIDILIDPLRKLSAFGHFVFTFCAACTAAVFWELAEFAADLTFGSKIQHEIRETMMDLVFGTLGAGLTVALLVIFSNRRRVPQN